MVYSINVTFRINALRSPPREPEMSDKVYFLRRRESRNGLLPIDGDWLVWRLVCDE